MGWLTGLSLKAYLYAGLALVILALGVAVKVQSSRLETCKTGFEAFKATVKAEGEAAAKEAARVNLANQKAKEGADREYAKTKGDLASAYAAYRKLRNDNAGRGFVPTPAPDSPNPDRACFSRTLLNSAISDFDRGVTGLIEKGDVAQLRLIGGMKWAESIGKP